LFSANAFTSAENHIPKIASTPLEQIRLLLAEALAPSSLRSKAADFRRQNVRNQPIRAQSLQSDSLISFVFNKRIFIRRKSHRKDRFNSFRTDSALCTQ
jgi:hypothetical protein